MYVDDPGPKQYHVANGRQHHTYLNITPARDARSSFAPGKYAVSRMELPLMCMGEWFLLNGV
jgi:hypothetical protein